MKTERNMLIAFILNLVFSLFEFIGGGVIGSVAILSDAVHDLGDAASIGISLFLERKSKKQSDEAHTFGYARYSVLGGMITTLVLIFGSVAVIINAVHRIINPAKIDYSGMIVFAAIGTAVNFLAAFLTRNGDSVNQKAVNLHMLEDVLGWIVVLIGAVVMRFTDFSLIDPILSVGISIFILLSAAKNLKKIIDLFLDKTPYGISVSQITEHLLEIDGVTDVHHIHIRSVDGINNVATMHVVADGDFHAVKEAVRKSLAEDGINHVTIETETSDEDCRDEKCGICAKTTAHHHHHHN